MKLLIKVKNRVSKIISEPKMLFVYIRSKLAKEKLYKELENKNTKSGISELFFILSFDCDTRKDIEVIKDVIEKLHVINIKPVLAVPGELLIEGKQVYTTLLDYGVEFINHGYKSHSEKTTKGYISTFDYKDISFDEVADDIKRGDSALKEVLDVQVNGFRTPHFGNFQKKQQLSFLYEVISSLGYKYSTSTIPYFAFKNGSIFKQSDLFEIPVTGLISEPLRIFDSFLFYNNSENSLDSNAYSKEANLLIDFYKTNVNNGIINIYVDPSQIYSSEAFFDAMKTLTKFTHNVTYSELIAEIE